MSSQPNGSRRTFSGRDQNVTFQSDENATLVPNTKHRQSTSRAGDSLSNTTGRLSIRHKASSSLFSQQLQAASYNIEHVDQHQANKNHIQASKSFAPSRGEGPSHASFCDPCANIKARP